MSLDLLNELEKRVQSAVGTIEDLKAEIELLKEENAALVAEKGAWEGRLAELLGKFDLMDNAAESAVQAEDDVTAEESNIAELAQSDFDAADSLDQADSAEENLMSDAFAEETDSTSQDNNTGFGNASSY